MSKSRIAPLPGGVSFDFNGAAVIVTGGTRGIGRAVAEAFLSAGARVAVTYARNQAAAREFAGAHEDAGERLLTECCDVTDPEAVERFFEQFDAWSDRLDVLVNNAGIRRDAVVGMMREDDWRAVIETNLSGVFRMSKYAVQRMSPARHGRIITITSPSGRIGFPGQANYAASKAGEVGFMRSLAREVARRGITANCVSPGFIDTDFIRDLPDDVRREYQTMVPARRFGKPEEVAAAVLFLSSSEAAYVNGTVIEVSGGL